MCIAEQKAEYMYIKVELKGVKKRQMGSRVRRIPLRE